ncbi:cytochrome b [Gluconacetobacter tumulicola]
MTFVLISLLTIRNFPRNIGYFLLLGDRVFRSGSRQEYVLGHGPSSWGPSMTEAFSNATDKLRYDRGTVLLHWATAVLVLIQFALGETWGWPGKPVHHLMVVTHLTGGMFLTAIILFRIVWRITWGRHLASLLSPVDRFCALAMESTLYALLLAEIGLGYAWRWGAGQAMSFFGLLIPSPFTPFSSGTIWWIETLHFWNAWLIVGLATGHAAAALFHQCVLRDNVLARMLPAGTLLPRAKP